MPAKDLREKRAKLVKDAQVIIAKAEATAEDLARADAMMDESDAIMAQITRLERSDTLAADIERAIQASAAHLDPAVRHLPFDMAREVRIANDLQHRGAALADMQPEDRDYWRESVAREKRVLRAMALGRIAGLSEDDREHYASRFQNAGSVGTDSAGGYTVAPLFEADLLIALKAFGGMRQAARVITTTTGASLPWPTLDDTSNVATILATENTTVGSGTDLAFGQKTLGAYTYISGAIPVSLQLLQDSVFDFDSLITQAIATRFARGQNAHFTTGTGTGQPKGVVTAAASGTTGGDGQQTTIIYDDFVNLVHSVDPAYRNGAAFMMHDTSIKVLRLLKDTLGRPLWQPSLTAGTPDTLLTYPILVNQDMPVMAASAKSVLFGNFNNYLIRDTLGLQMMVLRERYADLLQVAWIAYMRSDGDLISAASPIKYYANTAAA